MKNFLLYILVFTFMIISCKKREDTTNSTSDPTPSYRITKMKYTYGPSPDEHQITFTYIGNKISIINDIWSPTHSDSYTYIYDNNDRVIEIQISSIGDNGNWHQVSQKVLYYYQNNILIKIKDTISKTGSYEHWDEKTEATLVYVNNRIDSIIFSYKRFHTYYSPPNVITDSAFVIETEKCEYIGNNLSKSIYNGVSVTYEYDDKINPFKLIGLAPVPTYQSFAFNYLPVNDIFLGMIGFSENNAIRFYRNGTLIDNLDLEYNSLGYPTKFITNYGSNTIINGTIEYEKVN